MQSMQDFANTASKEKPTSKCLPQPTGQTPTITSDPNDFLRQSERRVVVGERGAKQAVRNSYQKHNWRQSERRVVVGERGAKQAAQNSYQKHNCHTYTCTHIWGGGGGGICRGRGNLEVGGGEMINYKWSYYTDYQILNKLIL